MKRKEEVKLLNKLVTFEEYQENILNNIYPLAIKLNEEESKNYLESKFPYVFLNLREDFKNMYSRTTDPKDKNLIRLYLNAYELRKKIAYDKIFVSTFIEATQEEKYIDYISESYGYDLDAPRIIFRKKPRLFFKQLDYYDPNKNDITKGEDLLVMSFKLALGREIK